MSPMCMNVNVRVELCEHDGVSEAHTMNARTVCMYGIENEDASM